MDGWTAVTVSAGTSAVISALVSLLAVHQTTVRRAKAERTDASRQAVRHAVEPLLRELARYKYLDRTSPKRSEEQSHLEDHTCIVTIREAASDLPRHRRWLVDRRCRKTFGNYWTDLAVDLPTSANESGTFSAWLASSLKDNKVSQVYGPTRGLLHRAYMERPGHPLQEELRRNLKRLAACR